MIFSNVRVKSPIGKMIESNIFEFLTYPFFLSHSLSIMIVKYKTIKNSILYN